MLEKWKNLSAQAKAGIIGGTVLLAAAGVGLGITQPWNQQQVQQPADPPPIQQQAPQEPVREPEEGLSVRAGSETVPCTLYEGDGWSIYLPEGWSAEKKGERDALLQDGNGNGLSVSFLPEGGYEGSFVNLSGGDKERTLQFYQGTGQNSPAVSGVGAESRWDYYSKLFTALARTLTVGEEKPFGEVYVIPQKPDWQKAEGSTVLFLDKDGYVMDDTVQEAVEEYMQSWPAESRDRYTGQYRIHDITWVSSYTGIVEDGYIDVFRADVQYRLKEDAGSNGWAAGEEDVFLAISHDGGSVEETQSVVTAAGGGWVEFARMLR